MAYLNNSLSGNDMKSIQREVALIKQDNGLDARDCLGEDVFLLLEKAGTLIFYPIDGEDLWGIYIYKDDKHFFIINSCIELERQVFAAAHELAHSLEIAKVSYEAVTADLLVEYTNHKTYGSDLKKADFIANRFAAELLVSDKALKERLFSLPEHYDMVSKAVIISGEFLVPYRTIVKRLLETRIITETKQIEKLLNADEKQVRQTAERYECCPRNYEISRKKRLGKYANRALTLYDNDLCTYKELCKKLELIGKTPEDFGVQYYDLDLSEFILRAAEEPDTEYSQDE